MMNIDWKAVWQEMDEYRAASFEKNLRFPGEKRERAHLPAVVAKNTKLEPSSQYQRLLNAQNAASGVLVGANIHYNVEHPGVNIDAVHNRKE